MYKKLPYNKRTKNRNVPKKIPPRRLEKITARWVLPFPCARLPSEKKLITQIKNHLAASLLFIKKEEE